MLLKFLISTNCQKPAFDRPEKTIQYSSAQSAQPLFRINPFSRFINQLKLSSPSIFVSRISFIISHLYINTDNYLHPFLTVIHLNLNHPVTGPQIGLQGYNINLINGKPSYLVFQDTISNQFPLVKPNLV